MKLLKDISELLICASVAIILFLNVHISRKQVACFQTVSSLVAFPPTPVTLGEIWVHFGLYILWSFKQTFPPANVRSSAQRVDRGARQTGVISAAPQVGGSALVSLVVLLIRLHRQTAPEK